MITQPITILIFTCFQFFFFLILNINLQRQRSKPVSLSSSQSRRVTFNIWRAMIIAVGYTIKPSLH